MNILILTGRFGMGHVKAAEAIKENLLQTDSEANVKIIDFIDYMFPKSNNYIYGVFNFMVSKCSGVYNMLNQLAGNSKGSVPLKYMISSKISSLVNSYKADIIVAAFPICGQYISAYKEMSGSNLPLYTYITDITAHEEWIAENTDMYFVGDETTQNILISKGISKERVIISGIPVRQCFKTEIEGSNVLPIKKHLLIMGGGLGLLPASQELLRVINDRQDFQATLIAGKNRKLQMEAAAKYPNINVIGYTNQVHKYMHEADLIITKSGGITTFEAIASRTPLYIIRPFLEQEFGNAQFIESKNIGRVIWSKDVNVEEDLTALMDNHKLLQTMKANMERIEASFSSSNPIEDFAEREMTKCCQNM